MTRFYEIHGGEDQRVRIKSQDKVYTFLYSEDNGETWIQIGSMLKSDYYIRLHADVALDMAWVLPWWPFRLIFQYEPEYLEWLVETKGIHE